MINTRHSGQEAIPDIYKQNKNIFLTICRKTNGNVVVFEALLDKNNCLKNIDTYWLDLDPDFRERAMKTRGTIRDEFTLIDKYAYDILITEKHPKQWKFQFKRFPSQLLTAKVHDCKVSCYTNKNGINIKIHHMFVYMKSGSTKLLPLVDFIRIIGVRMDSNTPISFDITNNFF